MSDGSANNYSYWYYSNFLCNGTRVNVVLAKTVERTGTSNFQEVCGGGAILPFQLHLIPRAYAQATCDLTFNPSIVSKPDNASAQVQVSWNPAGYRGRLHVSGPSGCIFCPNTGDPSGMMLTIPSKAPIGTYSVNLNPTRGGFTQCTKTFQVVNPPSKTACNDGVDNSDAEDNLVDEEDPGCHTDDDLTKPYNRAITSEDNTVIAPPSSDPAFIGSYVIILK